MSEQQTNAHPTSGVQDLASLLKDYVPAHVHNEILDALNELDQENAQLRQRLEAIDTRLGDDLSIDDVFDRMAELEGKVRTRSYQDAWKGIADELRIDEDFREDLFDSMGFEMDRDEPDVKAMGKRAREWFEAKESRKKYLKAAEEGREGAEDEGSAEGATPQARDRGNTPARPRLHAEDGGGRGAEVPGGKSFRYRPENLSDPEWMRQNGVQYARAVAEGRAQRVS